MGAGFLINPLLRQYKLIIDFLYLWDMKTNSRRILMARLKVSSVSDEIYIIFDRYHIVEFKFDYFLFLYIAMLV